MTQHVSHRRSDEVHQAHELLERLTADHSTRTEREAAAEIERLRLKVPDRDKLLAEIERLRAALSPFAYEYDILMQQQDAFPAWHSVKTAHLREARRALEPKL